MRSSDLPHKIAQSVIDEIRSRLLAPGAPVRTQRLADRFGVSRTPIREALTLLAEQGFVEQHQNRGYFVCATVPVAAEAGEMIRDMDDYQRLASDWLRDEIPAEVTELFLRERYGLTKARVNDILVRATREGWVERKQGYGWRFLPVAKTAEAFEQIYRFRMVIEPAALLEPGFTVDRPALAEQRRIQQRMLDEDIRTGAPETLLGNGARLHEEIARMSGNPFFHMSLVRVNRMRRLMEYRANLNRDRLVRQCTEHLALLDLIERGEVVEASFLMRKHLSGALQRKSPVAAAPAEADGAA
ncbi:GntR family transcriptional regulator [Frigidibacter sp. MR17.14]|uniref:GntR family transcriptional regulator n=1 Tax=Frigidibacter sp. MR17.14 TaxID=3126509 RepID=UPI003012BD8C